MRLWKVAAALAVAAAGAAALAAPVVEGRATAEARRLAAAAGLSVGGVRFSWLAPLELQHVALAPRAGTLVTVDAVRIGWRLAGGADARAHVSRVTLDGL